MIAMGILSSVLHQTGFFLLFFAVPVQLLAVRRGKTAFLNGAMVSIGVIAIWKGFQIMRLNAAYADSVLVMLDLLLPVAIFCGLGLVNYIRITPEEDWLKLAIGSLLAVLLIVPLLIYAQHSPFFIVVVEAQHAFLQEQGIMTEASVEQLLSRMMVMLFRGVGSIVTGMLAINYYFGASVAGDRTRLQRLKMPRYTIVAAAIAGVLILLNSYELLTIAAWNLMSVVLVLHALIGMSVFGKLIAHKVPSGQARWVFLGALLLIVFVPMVNVLVFISLPVAGIVDTLTNIRERIGTRSDG